MLKAFMNNPTKLVGGALLLFAGLQQQLPMFQTMLSPLGYAVFTVSIGLIVTFLGKLRDVTGGTFWNNKMTIVGLLLIFFGVVQGFMSQFEPLLSPKAFQWFSGLVGLVVGALGVLNGRSVPAPAQPATPATP